MKGWRAAGAAMVARYLADDFSKLLGARKPRDRRARIVSGRRVTLH